MSYQARDYSNLLGMEGFSETLLKNHFSLYNGYVNNTNKVLETMQSLLHEGKAGSLEFSELKRRLGWEFNGMRLHEYYFENLGGDGALDPLSPLTGKIKEEFSSFEIWEQEFKATALMRGIGWVILYQDPVSQKMFNMWINEHDIGHPAGLKPLLVLDVFEHAFISDYGLKKADYVGAFFRKINWHKVEERTR